MMSRRKNRRNNPEQAPVAPVQPSEEAPEPAVSADELRDLLDRLALVERQQQQPEDPSPVAARKRERERWAATNTRTDSDEPCPACGTAGGEQRRISGSLFRKSPAWACVPCVNVMIDGYDTNRVRTFTTAVTLDRLAALAAGMDRPTRSLRALASRHGLTFTLAMDSDGGDGTAWSHLGQRDLGRWAEVGAKALRRDAAGFGVFPAVPVSALRPEMVDGRVADLTHPRGWRHSLVPKPVEPPSAEQLAAQLAAEEAAIEAELIALHRKEVEKTEEAARKAERARIDAEYRKAVRAQEALFATHRRKLREARAMVLESADTRADFNAIVSGL